MNAPPSPLDRLRQAYGPGPRTTWARRFLSVLLVMVALLYLFRFGLPGFLLGGSYFTAGGPVTAHLDSEVRFLSALCIALGVLATWLIWNIERAPALAAGLACTSFLGGVGRLLSMTQYGSPEAPMLVATALELAIPLTVLFLLTRRRQA